MEVDAPELVETSIYIDALMEKVNESEEEATKREKQRKFVQVQRGLGLTNIDKCEVANTTDDGEQEERREIARQIVIKNLAIRRKMSSAKVMQSQGIPSKIFDGKLKLNKSRSVSIPESNSSLLKSVAGSENCFSPESTINLRVNSTRLSGARRGIFV